MLKTLSLIGKKLNEENILWGVGASILLNQYNLIKEPNDIDIFVHTKDIHKADNILKNMGIKKDREKTDTYLTKYFCEYIINQVDIDVMAGFKIKHKEGVYEYIFDEKSITKYIEINGVEIPFTSLEDWYVIYEIIPNREKKVELIKNYLISNKSSNKFLLERNLGANIPKSVKNKTKELVNELFEIND